MWSALAVIFIQDVVFQRKPSCFKLLETQSRWVEPQEDSIIDLKERLEIAASVLLERLE